MNNRLDRLQTRDKARTRQERQAESFRYNSEMERRLNIKANRPEVYDSQFSPEMKMSTGFYESAKQAAEAQGIDTSAPSDDE